MNSLKSLRIILNKEVSKGYEALLKEQCSAWNKRWESADIKIEGDTLAQQGYKI